MMFFWILGCAWEPLLDPALEDGAGVNQGEITNTISGSVVVDADQVLGDVIVLVYDAGDPPPPVGTGAPVTFATIPQGHFSGGNGVKSAPFVISELPDGDWTLSALMDTDANFHPLLTSNAGATCGDIVGVYPSALGGNERGVVPVFDGDLVEGIVIPLGYVYITERPAFFLSNREILLDAVMEGGVSWFSMESTGVHSEILELADPGSEACPSEFLVHMVDADGDGSVDLHPSEAYAEAGAWNIWPRVYMSFEEEDGSLWVSEGIVMPMFSSVVQAGEPTFSSVLNVQFPYAGQYISVSGEVEVVSAADFPIGDWSVTTITEAGQTWTVPNELSDFSSNSPSFDPLSQGMTLLVR